MAQTQVKVKAQTQTQVQARGRRKRKWLKPITLLKYLTFLVIVVVFFFPIFWMLSTSFKPNNEVINSPPIFVTSRPTISGYIEALEARGTIALRNSLIVSTAATIVSIVTGSLAAYSFARFKLGGFHLPFWILSTRMMPAVASIIPIFILFKNLGFIDTWYGISITHLVITLPFAVWMMRGFFMEVPVELEESAMIDGASRLKALFRVVLPITASGLAVTAFFTFIFSWNEFIFALILSRRAATTLPVLISGMHAAHGVLWSVMSALAVLGMIPVLVLAFFSQKYLVRGMTLGAIE
ncbi:MAG: carbohydrate ABC transporter permease [Candidatus Bipolaricaulia bacterium]